MDDIDINMNRDCPKCKNEMKSFSGIREPGSNDYLRIGFHCTECFRTYFINKKGELEFQKPDPKHGYAFIIKSGDDYFFTPHIYPECPEEIKFWKEFTSVTRTVRVFNLRTINKEIEFETSYNQEMFTIPEKVIEEYSFSENEWISYFIK